MTDHYTLFGFYASYYTAKTRGYLRKKGIPFVERLPSHPDFRGKVMPVSGTHKVQQILTPEGVVVQDTVEILDYLEARFPDLPAIPSTPRQKVYVHLMELLASEGLLMLAIQHRWLFSEENRTFLRMDLARSFNPQGTDEELMKIGNMFGDNILGENVKLLLGGDPQWDSFAASFALRGAPADKIKARLDREYLGLLALMENHLISHPWFLGGHPSAADYAIMGALHAHMGRDPAGLQLMQANAPRVFRWVEHMLVPEVQSPEFYDRAIEYPGGDEVPDTALKILHYIANLYAEKFVLGALAFNKAVERLSSEKGHVFNAEDIDAVLPSETVSYQGKEREGAANLYHIWILQRAQVSFQSLSNDEKASVLAMLGEGPAADLVSVPLTTRVARVNSRIVVA
jgi:glutathione S-transferase